MDLKQEILDAIKQYLINLGLCNDNIDICRMSNEIDITANKDGKSQIRIIYDVNEKDKQVRIPNIIVTNSFNFHGIGKKMIKIIYDISQKYEYDLFLVNMVDTFYEKMQNRGALVCCQPKAVQIIATTNLD